MIGMKLSGLKKDIPKQVYDILKEEDIDDLRPSQEKAVKKGLLKDKSLLVCTPTASGKTLIAELAFTRSILNGVGKAIYIVPLKALASEKHKEFKRKYGEHFKIALSIGDLDKSDPYLSKYDLIITTSEKLDSLIRHGASWLNQVHTIIVDEIHLMNDPGRGPTLEILLTMLRQMLEKAQIIGLSATIGNPKELAQWLDAELIIDKWRPVKLKQGTYFKGEIEFIK